MLSEVAKLFLRYNFAPEADRDVMHDVARHGREAIELSLKVFCEVYEADLDTDGTREVVKNIRENHEEAIKYAAGVLGMM